MLKADLLDSIKTTTLIAWGSGAAIAGYGALGNTKSDVEAFKVISWWALGPCALIVTLVLFALLLRGLHRWFGSPTETPVSPKGIGPERAVRADSVAANLDRVGPHGHVFLFLPVFNGNPYPVELRDRTSRPILYGADRVLSVVIALVSGGDGMIAAFSNGSIRVNINLSDEAGQALLADISARRVVKSIDLRGLDIRVVHGAREGRLDTPEAAAITFHREFWSSGRHVTINLGESAKVKD